MRNKALANIAEDAEKIDMLDLVEDRTAKSDTSRSQAGWAYNVIRRHILSGKHVPLKKLKIQDLARELSVSPGAVREALSRLVPERLVVSRDQRGFVVAPLSISDLEDLTDLRCDIERIALRRALERGDVDWEARIIAAEHRLRGVPRIVGDDEPCVNPDWAARHAAFHAALVSACGSPRLMALHGQLYEQSERYRGVSLHSEGARDVPDEHKKIMEYVLARDIDRTVEAAISHIQQTTKFLIEGPMMRTAQERD